MHASEGLIQRFYSAFQRRDAASMAAKSLEDYIRQK